MSTFIRLCRLYQAWLKAEHSFLLNSNINLEGEENLALSYWSLYYHKVLSLQQPVICIYASEQELLQSILTLCKTIIAWGRSAVYLVISILAVEVKEGKEEIGVRMSAQSVIHTVGLSTTTAEPHPKWATRVGDTSYQGRNDCMRCQAASVNGLQITSTNAFIVDHIRKRIKLHTNPGWVAHRIKKRKTRFLREILGASASAYEFWCPPSVFLPWKQERDQQLVNTRLSWELQSISVFSFQQTRYKF